MKQFYCVGVTVKGLSTEKAGVTSAFKFRRKGCTPRKKGVEEEYSCNKHYYFWEFLSDASKPLVSEFRNELYSNRLRCQRRVVAQVEGRPSLLLRYYMLYTDDGGGY